MRAERETLLADQSLQGAAFCRAYSALADGWLAGLLGDEPGVALAAVGGYGRGELSPGSDLDIILLHTGKPGGADAHIKELAERLWYPLWDAGLKLGHGVRTVKEALALANSDLDTATSLLTTRHVAGDPGLTATVAARGVEQWQDRSSRWLAELGAGITTRHRKAGEVAFLLEPDLKEGRGGLRDVHAQQWAEAAHRILLDGDDEALAAAYETLLSARVALQRRARRATDVLLLQEQDGVAADLGYGDADELMSAVSAAARTIAWTSDETWERIASSLQGPMGRRSSADRHVGAGLVIRDGQVELTVAADPAGDPTLILRAAAAAAEASTRLSRPALERLAAEGSVPEGVWPTEARLALVRLLGAGPAAIPVIEALDQRGLMVRILPEWEAVRCLPQRNAYHRFTVDRHLCEAAAEAARLAGDVRRPDLLLVGALLHDIGKGFPGDHTVAGIEVVGRIAPRMGFPPEDVAVLLTMVRHHLLLPDAATRRDTTDEATVAAVAAAAGDHSTLELLAALTEADSLATGPAAWGTWKAGLVRELVVNTIPVLAGEPARAVPDGPPAEAFPLMVQARDSNDLVVGTDGPFLLLAAPDRPGLFSKVAGTLAMCGLDVIAARVWSTDDGLAVERFRAISVVGGAVDWQQVEGELRKVLAGQVSLEARLADRARDYAFVAPRSPAAAPARIEVSIDNQASESATVVDVRAPDRIGTLYRITRALAELALDIRLAKVSSLGHEVVDAFYVVDASGAKITDTERLVELERGVVAHLGA
jgi:[protein-PII] uridylyltransferase